MFEPTVGVQSHGSGHAILAASGYFFQEIALSGINE
jgi:hypothetical protein